MPDTLIFTDPSYYLTDQFSVGVGGRYWAMWTTEGETSGFKGDAFKAEQAALLLQASYKFGGACCAQPLK